MTDVSITALLTCHTDIRLHRKINKKQKHYIDKGTSCLTYYEHSKCTKIYLLIRNILILVLHDPLSQ